MPGIHTAPIRFPEGWRKRWPEPDFSLVSFITHAGYKWQVPPATSGKRVLFLVQHTWIGPMFMDLSIHQNSLFTSSKDQNVSWCWISHKQCKIETWQGRLIESDMRRTELYYRQWPWSTFKVILAIFSENKYSPLFLSLEILGDLMNDDIGDDLSDLWRSFQLLWTISLSVFKKYSVRNVRSRLQRSDIICEQLFLLLYMTRRT